MECQIILFSYILTSITKNLNNDINHDFLCDFMKIHTELITAYRNLYALIHFIIIRVVENFLTIAIVFYNVVTMTSFLDFSQFFLFYYAFWE